MKSHLEMNANDDKLFSACEYINRYTAVTYVSKSMKLNSNTKPESVCSMYLENLIEDRGKMKE